MNRTFAWTVILLSLFYSNISSAQTAEIKPFDTATNENAASDRLYADAIKERVLNNDKEAEILLLRFLNAKPNVAAAYYELARINSRANNVEKAQQQIKRALVLDSDNKWYQEFYGNLLAAKNEYLTAADIFAKLAAKYKPNEDYLLKSALLYQRGGKNIKAIGQLEEVIKQRGLDEEVVIQISQLYVKDKNIEGAGNALHRLIDANPKEGRYYALLAELYDNNKMPEKAKGIYEEGERKFPNDISLQLGLASFYKRKKDEKNYSLYVNKAISNKNLDEQTQLTLLVSYLQETEKDSMSKVNGLVLTEQLVKAHPFNASILGIYGDLLSFNNRPQESIAAYKKSLSLDSGNINVWQQLLFNYTDKPSADSLILFSEKALTLFPSQAILYYLNGIGHINKGELTQGIKAITTAIDFQPEDNKPLLAEMYSSLGDAYNSNKDFKNADANFDKSLNINPSNATVLNNYAYYLSVRGTRLDDAEQFSKKSLELRPGEATFLDTYGWIFYQQGKYQKAKELIQQAIEKNGKDTDATLFEHLGDIYYKLNEIDKAVLYWQKAKEKEPLNEEIDKKIKNRKL
jgi:tetratricopeptide (TPR) repeat protein